MDYIVVSDVFSKTFSNSCPLFAHPHLFLYTSDKGQEDVGNVPQVFTNND
jgi:hypothetical protein